MTVIPQNINSQTISIQDFAKIEIRVGKVTQAENVNDSTKLIRLHVDLGDFGTRIIFTGVRSYGYYPADFIGKQFLFVTNLESKKIMTEESQGMILAVDGLELPFEQHGSVKPLFIEVNHLPLGSKIR
ncbi:hypothetical protein A3A66_03425 [Microgenomates group bacterium RIFCSPLOWO2_01_FULL_46_13]|nr:MAG: hypothetical protein A2783_04605 [Microgenomates group bacterium RIFCSPHIGHO2_01_FULL_45_11]OGV95042.1 MAG: hypothetical protein A3A66_03425 [Microgenomates group bacterium RIFCSPLOWO2_01_FULL_46_13]